MRITARKGLIFLMALLLSVPALFARGADNVAALPNRQDGTFIIKAFKFQSGETMAELKPEIVVECGPPAETILRVAQSRQVDLIVMGAHHATAKSLVAHLPWATTSSVICQSHCPVLTVRN